MGGEKHRGLHYLGCKQGSPPRGRGKDRSKGAAVREYGITPAWAGKSALFSPPFDNPEDHPRVGGEKPLFRVVLTMREGSPPRGRGKDVLPHGLTLTVWITPAWAGKSALKFFCFEVLWDHPRVGGEKRKEEAGAKTRLGSPPRGRGKAWKPGEKRPDSGITPAWAGKRLKRSHRSGIFISGPIPFHSVLHRPAGSGGSRAGRDGAPAGQPQNAGPA